MADLGHFDARNVDPTPDFEPVPAGRYTAVITASEMKPTKSGTGRYLELSFEIIEGTHKGRRLWTRLNLENRSEMAVEIAKAELSAICRAVGVLDLQDSEQLHSLPLVIRVRCRRRDDTGELTNEVHGFSKKEPPQPPNPQAPASNSSLPWKRPG